METELPVELRAALYDIQRYLLDEIPPLTASEAVETLMTQPPQLLMHLVHGWAIEQSRLQSAAMCDFLFHAIRKIHTVSALNLVDEKALDAYLAGVIPLALQACPADERETLQTSLAAMRQSHSFAAAPVDLHRAAPLAAPPAPARPPAAPAPAPAGPAGGTARRLSLVMERLTNLLRTSMAGPAGAPPAPAPRPTAQLVSLAAASSNSEEELQQYIASLRPYTGGVKSENLFGVLAAGIAPWDIALPPGAGSKAPPVEAMHRIMTLTRDPMESLKRFRELMTTAVEQFNKGALTASVSMLELADTVAVEKKIDPTTVSRIREALVESLSSEQLRKLAENRTRHPLLRKALGAFPSLTIEGLFGQLRGEGRPERRRQLLALLEAWGPGARARSLDELEAELKRLPDEVDTYYLRNLIYLLHRIPREEGPVERELALLTQATDRGQSIYVVKEAILPLGQISTDASVRLLTTRLAEFETLLIKKETSIYPATEMQKTIDRIVVALGRIGTPAALLTVARHGMKPNPLLGDTRARLTALGQHDLSFDEQTVDLLIRTIREDLPSTLLGKLLPKRQPPPIPLIEALASTRSERVEELFQEIAQKYPDDPTGVAAAAALANLTGGAKRRDAKTPTLTGDLEFFGLPSLLQSLTDTAATGIVTLTARDSGQTAGKLLVVGGKFADAQVANLRGADAVYQLLERPVVGFFAFVPHPPENVPVKGELRDVMGLLLEGIRRHDELNAAATVVPDELKLAAGGVKPTADPEETDPALTREVWLKAISGQPVGSWEGEIPADAFRIRRLLARWMEEGALQPA